MNNLKFFLDAAKIQKQYEQLVKSHKLSKKAMCDLCIPFRDTYNLTDLQTLRIVRKEMDLSEMINLQGIYEEV